MKFLAVFAIILGVVFAQEPVSLNCNLALTIQGYTCTISATNLQQVRNVVISAENHLENRNNNDVITFSMHNSRISFFPLHAFESFPNLENVIFTQNNIPMLESNVFGNRNRIRFLNLQGNSIGNIQAGAFNGLLNLETLILNTNPFASLPERIFESLINLRSLQAEFAGLMRIEANLFANNPNLNVINLQFNPVRFIHRGTFDNQRRLQELRLGGATCGAGANLNFFDIQNGDLTNILPQLSHCFGVTPINCEFTNDTQILGISEFGYTCTVEDQILEERQRSEVKEFGGSHLAGMANDNVINLRINYSNIPFYLPEMFSTFPNLRAIEITNGGLQQIRPGDFRAGVDLESIYMQYNNLKALGGGLFAGLSKLQKLSLGKNEIERIDGNAFSGLTSLRLLYLHDNRITRLHRNSFNSLPELRDLNLSRNYLKRISSLLFNNNPKVGVIMMDSNQIAAIDEGLLDKLPRLAVLNVLYNRCVNALFDGNRNRINEGLRNCYAEYEKLPSDDTRQLIMEIDGEARLIDNDGGRIEL